MTDSTTEMFIPIGEDKKDTAPQYPPPQSVIMAMSVYLSMYYMSDNPEYLRLAYRIVHAAYHEMDAFEPIQHLGNPRAGLTDPNAAAERVREHWPHLEHVTASAIAAIKSVLREENRLIQSTELHAIIALGCTKIHERPAEAVQMAREAMHIVKLTTPPPRPCLSDGTIAEVRRLARRAMMRICMQDVPTGQGIIEMEFLPVIAKLAETYLEARE